ncbi:hypothetical protein CASFOL_020937 [Castilleja foliolosa]|uniref:Transmembrane protein n=1 Tax=Castilleja foliolosa TaxID=1961234 RepID=A0ABD3D296_9LAMI
MANYMRALLLSIFIAFFILHFSPAVTSISLHPGKSLYGHKITYSSLHDVAKPIKHLSLKRVSLSPPPSPKYSQSPP